MDDQVFLNDPGDDTDGVDPRFIEDQRVMTSRVELRIDIRHRGNLPTAETISTWLAGQLARELKLADISEVGTPSYTFGRRTSIGPEDGEGVDFFLRSAFIHSKANALHGGSTRTIEEV